MKLMFVENGTD